MRYERKTLKDISFFKKVMNRVALIIIRNNRNDKILCQLRDDKPEVSYAGHWGVIGGQIEKNEDPLDAIKREIVEEISCNVEDIEFVNRINHLKTQYCEKHELFIFKGKLDKNSEDIKIGEGQRVDYFTVDEIENLRMSETLKEFIMKNRKKLLS